MVGVKEEMMKKSIYITVVFMLMLIFIGCFATMTPDQRKELYDLRENVGNKPFVGSVGSSYTYDRWGFIESTRY
jgi:hypothetical protein